MTKGLLGNQTGRRLASDSLAEYQVAFAFNRLIIGPGNKTFVFVCGHRPKTKELLELLFMLFFSISLVFLHKKFK